jgi:hypothetical protein
MCQDGYRQSLDLDLASSSLPEATLQHGNLRCNPKAQPLVG